MTAILALLGRTWKIWLPGALVLAAATTIWAQRLQLHAAKAERDVAIHEHNQAMEEQRQLLSDLDRLNNILARRKAQEQKLEADLEDSKKRIRALASSRPDVADWRAAPLPDGLWREARGAQSQDPDRAHQPGQDPGRRANQ